MEEFQEADVLWPEEKLQPTMTQDLRKLMSPETGSPRKSSKSTTPITIPSVASSGSWKLEFLDLRDVDNCDISNGAEGKKEIVPPHMVVSRRCSGEMPFSVCTGSGRTLKGRDLRQVRNSVLRLTGFLEG